MNFNADADGVRSDDIIDRLLETQTVSPAAAMDDAMAGRVFK